MPRIICTSDQLIARLKTLASRKTFYKNKYPYNLCYIHPDGRTSADCVNLYKALFNGYDVNKTNPGYFQRDLSNTGDVTEYGLLKQCSDISSDFKKLKDGIPEVLYMPGHIGGYIGTVTKGQYTYNVIECTGAWGGGIIYSWVDTDGTRRKYKGSSSTGGKWTKHGKPTKWISYGAVPAPVPVPVEDKKYYTVKKGDTVWAICKRNKITLKQFAGLNPQLHNLNIIYPGQKVRVK